MKALRFLEALSKVIETGPICPEIFVDPHAATSQNRFDSFVPVTRECMDVMKLLVFYLFKTLRRVSKGLYDEN
jgi:hypothetical protein